jgi:hypothetical protein
MTTDDRAVAAMKAFAHNAAALDAEIGRRVRHVKDCAMSRGRGFTDCGLRNCGGRMDRLCGGAPVLLPTSPWVSPLWW